MIRSRTVVFVIAVFFLVCSQVHALEFETSTGDEDIVFMSTDSEVNLGDSLSKSVEKQFTVVEDEAMQARVQEIGQRIASVCDRKDIFYHFTVIDDEKKEKPIVNAFALPGGYVYLFKDLCDEVQSDDELAGIIAHEVAHIVARHGVKKMQASLGYNILVLLAHRVEDNPANVGRAYSAIHSLMLSYSREDEAVADNFSVKYVKKAGFNPEGVINFLTRLLEIQKERPERRFFGSMSHPYLSVRLANVKKEVYGKMDFVDYINIPTSTRR